MNDYDYDTVVVLTFLAKQLYLPFKIFSSSFFQLDTQL